MADDSTIKGASTFTFLDKIGSLGANAIGGFGFLRTGKGVFGGAGVVENGATLIGSAGVTAYVDTPTASVGAKPNLSGETSRTSPRANFALQGGVHGAHDNEHVSVGVRAETMARVTPNGSINQTHTTTSRLELGTGGVSSKMSGMLEGHATPKASAYVYAENKHSYSPSQGADNMQIVGIGVSKGGIKLNGVTMSGNCDVAHTRPEHGLNSVGVQCNVNARWK